MITNEKNIFRFFRKLIMFAVEIFCLIRALFVIILCKKNNTGAGKEYENLNQVRRKLAILLLISGIVTGALALLGYSMLFGNTIKVEDGPVEILIGSGDSYEDVEKMVLDSLNIRNPSVLRWVADKKSYPELVKRGRFIINKDLSYVRLVDLLRAGDQTPVDVTFNNIRTLNDLAGKVGQQIEADSTEIIGFLMDPLNYEKDGFTRETVIAVFIPDTYEMYWNTTPVGFYNRMLREYNKFWNEQRMSLANAKDLTPIEVATLASIIDDEVVKADEKPRIAGVYMNRLQMGMPLQACPTIKFALNDFTITRVLNVHLVVESPYNTYKYRGLPPGPIGCPTIEGIEAVLNAEEHDYIFFAAKADFSGYHNFSKTLSEHNRYADEYQRELDRRRIFN